MNCKKIQDIIITDYIDNELDGQRQKEIKEHLDNCVACRAFQEALVAMVREPLHNAETAVPPEALWIKIKNRLEQEEENGNYPALEDLFFAFRPKWVNVALVILLFLFTAVAGHYLTTEALVTDSGQPASANSEVTNNLGLSTFNDMPDERVQVAYNNIIGG
jgi:hypothetical protein